MQLNRLHFVRHVSPIIFRDLIIFKGAAGWDFCGRRRGGKGQCAFIPSKQMGLGVLLGF